MSCCDSVGIVNRKTHIFIMWFCYWLTSFWSVQQRFAMKFTFKSDWITGVTENLICFSSYILLWTFIPFSLTFPSLLCALLPQQKRFLRCSPFDEFNLWRSQVDNGSKKGGERLSILTKSLLLRRTKDQLDSTGRPLVIKFVPVPGGGQGRNMTVSLSWVEQPSALLQDPLSLPSSCEEAPGLQFHA